MSAINASDYITLRLNPYLMAALPEVPDHVRVAIKHAIEAVVKTYAREADEVKLARLVASVMAVVEKEKGQEWDGPMKKAVAAAVTESVLAELAQQGVPHAATLHQMSTNRTLLAGLIEWVIDVDWGRYAVNTRRWVVRQWRKLRRCCRRHCCCCC